MNDVNNLELINCSSDYEISEDFIKSKTIYELILIVLNEELKNRYIKPNDGIPRTDLASDVLTDLNLAQSAVLPKQLENLVNINDLSKIAFSGKFEDLKDIPTQFNIKIDATLNTESTSPVLNKVITSEIAKLLKKISSNTLNLMTLTIAMLDKANLLLIPTKVSQLSNDAEYTKREIFADVAFTGDYNSLKNKPSIQPGVSIDVDSNLSLSSTNPVENRVITRELNKKVDSEEFSRELSKKVNIDSLASALAGKLDKFTSNTVLGSINGHTLKYGGSVYIPTSEGSGDNSFRGSGSYREARDYADEHSNEIFQWLLKDYDGEYLVTKIIWHITDPDIFIDAIGAVISNN